MFVIERRNVKRILLFFICLFLLFTLELVLVNGDTNPEKQYFEVSLEENFVDNELIVILTNAESLLCKNYSCQDFIEVNPISIQDLSKGYNEKIREQQNNCFLSPNPIKLDKFN